MDAVRIQDEDIRQQIGYRQGHGYILESDSDLEIIDDAHGRRRGRRAFIACIASSRDIVLS